MNSLIKKYRVLRFKKGEVKSVEDEVIVETLIEIRVNNMPLVVLHAAPKDVEALAVGFLITEGLVRKLEEFHSVKVEGDRVYVNTSETVQDRIKLHKVKTKMVKTSCGETSERPLNALQTISKLKVNSSVYWTPEEILGVVKALNFNAELYRRTGGAHVALIVDKKGFSAMGEDVGRHNAVDKAVGKCILKGFTNFQNTLLACSGRLSSDMVLKAARTGIPVLVSISAPTSLGLNLANQLGLTLIGFARAMRFNVYCHQSRIKM